MESWGFKYRKQHKAVWQSLYGLSVPSSADTVTSTCHSLDAHRISPICSTTIATKVNSVLRQHRSVFCFLDWCRLFQMSVAGRWSHNQCDTAESDIGDISKVPQILMGVNKTRVQSVLLHTLLTCFPSASMPDFALTQPLQILLPEKQTVLHLACCLAGTVSWVPHPKKNILHLMGTWKIMPYLCTTRQYSSRWQGQITTALHCFTICFASLNPSIFH